MPNIDPRVIAEVEDLVSTGTRINQQVSTAGRGLDPEALSNVASWVTRLGQLIRKLYGEHSQHFVSYSAAAGASNFYNLWMKHYSHFTQMLGIARAIKHEIDSDLLVDFRLLVQADIFADFLEMGEYLLNEGYKDAAAVIIGSVLEDHLRTLSKRAGLETTGDGGKPMTIDPLNSQLAKAGCYSKLVQKQITTWAHIRNKAAHGEYGEYNLEQVRMMLMFVQSCVTPS
jgi:hypothetical protein